MTGRNPRRIRIVLSTVSFLLSVLLFAFGGSALAGFASLQFGPALLSLAAGLAVFGLAAAATTLALSFLFGRVFCAALCPLGAVQDGIRVGLRRRPGGIPNFKALRYVVAFAAIALLIGGWSSAFRLLDPFSRFGAMVSSAAMVARDVAESRVVDWPAAIGGLAFLVAIVLLVWWKRRIFCVSLCPVGTVLGLFSRRGWHGIRLNDACGGCGRCERLCPTGCIDVASGEVDNERCVLCLDCLAACKAGGVIYSRRIRRPSAAGVADGSRRTFLVKGAAAVVGAVAAGCGVRDLAGSGVNAGEHADGILPPGAGGAARFDRLCTGCRLCASACPTRIIRSRWFGLGSVRLDYDRGKCEYTCNRCSNVCPTGALRPLSLEDKQWLRMGEVEFEPSRCHAAVREPCSRCAAACPVGAIYQPSPEEPPEMNPYHCVGCGACQSVCPAAPKAIAVRSLGRQEAI